MSDLQGFAIVVAYLTPIALFIDLPRWKLYLAIDIGVLALACAI